MLRALHNRAIVERSAEQRNTESGIILQQDISEIVYAQVMALGPSITADIQLGDRLLVDWSQAQEIRYQGRCLYILPEEALIARRED